MTVVYIIGSLIFGLLYIYCIVAYGEYILSLAERKEPDPAKQSRSPKAVD